MNTFSNQYFLAIDIGGTFTDLVLVNSNGGSLAVSKVLTTSPDPSEGVLKGVVSLLEREGKDGRDVSRVIHGTTLVTNTLIERRGTLTGLLTTEGFRDALEIGREGRYDIYDLFLENPEPLVERRLRLEIPERLNVRGKVLTPLDESALQRACDIFRNEKVGAVAISFLHSYANPLHEQRVAEIVQETLPGIVLSVSHRVAPELREYERTSTTVANAYVKPMAEQYLSKLEQGLQKCGLTAPLHIMLSNGGTCSVETAVEFPIRLVESGPCGGALSAIYWGKRTGQKNVLAFDMGGTTAKAILSSRAGYLITTESEVARIYRFKRGSGLPLLVPVMDMIEIGAGGGSIAGLNELGLPVVGPESAGAFPGPACYGQGGTLPTVTDADLILGFLNPEYFLGGIMPLEVDHAREAVGSLAKPMKMDIDRMAWGIRRLVNENMANAGRIHAAERGVDLRNYSMVATGGAGPMHACEVAERLGINTIVIPPVAGVGSAFGLILAPISFEFSRSYPSRLKDLDLRKLNEIFLEMEQEGLKIVEDSGVDCTLVQVVRMVDIRYVGQGHEIRIGVPNGELDQDGICKIQAEFDNEYQRIFGRTCDGVELELIHWRVTVSGPKPDLGEFNAIGKNETEDSLKGHRLVVFDPEEGPVNVKIYNRYTLETNFAALGPVIIEESESTTVVSPDWSILQDPSGCLILTQLGGGR